MSNKRVFTTVLKSQPLPPKAGDKASELPSESAPSSVDEPPAVKRKPSEVTEGFKTAEDISSGDDAEEKSAVSEVEELPDGGAPPGKARGKKAGRPLLTHFLA
ncbi:hypothetical protein FOZ62_005903, partial [Perkinsus olseni]